jgi:hypothetical protein
MAEENPVFTHTPELRRLQESAGLAIEAYLRAVEARRIELGIVDVVAEEGEYITDEHFLTAWAVISEFSNPLDEVNEPVLLYGRGRSTTPAHAIGLGKILMDWW